MFLGLTQEFFGGIIDAMGVLCIQSIGMGTTRLTGQYIQIGLILYLAIVTPATMAFVIVMDDILAFFGFDEETVRVNFWEWNGMASLISLFAY
jgi:energy-converting hydrogenase Eha subunit G